MKEEGVMSTGESGSIKSEADEETVDVTSGADPLHDFLSDVAAFLRADR